MKNWFVGSLLAGFVGFGLTGCDPGNPESIGEPDGIEDVAMPPPEGFAAAFYVSTDGDDGNVGSRKRPFATLERARDAVRTLLPEMAGDILVEVAAGDYHLTQPFVLSPEDSGRNGHRVVYRGEGEPGSARLIGGERITNWSSVDGNIFRADLEEGREFSTLYEDGIRARKARFPNYEFDARFPQSGATYLTAEGGSANELIWKDGDLRGIDPMVLEGRGNLVVWPHSYADWNKNVREIGLVAPENRSLKLADRKVNVEIGKQARYYVEGPLELLDQPGEFALDADENALYYWPRFGDPAAAEIIAPRLTRIISLEGTDVNNPVRDVVIEGFGLSATDTFSAMTGPTGFPWSVNSNGAHGIVHLRYTEDVEVLFNRISGSGMNGIYLDRSNKRDRIYGNWISNCGISGVVIAYHREAKEFPDDINEGNLVENNRIEGLGAIAVDSAGVNIWGARDNIVRHCDISDGARYGVSIRGNFAQITGGLTNRDMPETNRHVTRGNRVEFSRLSRLGQDSGDTGAVHMAGISSRTVHPVNTLEQLLIEEIEPHPSMRDVKPNGIFFDYPDGVTDQVLRNIEIREVGVPFRVNNTDIRHTYDNVSWKEGFDPAAIERDRIGLRGDFPAAFAASEQVKDVVVREVPSAEERVLEVSWSVPPEGNAAKVLVSAEGVNGMETFEFDSGAGRAVVPRPRADRLVMLRLRTETANGNRSQGVLVPAAEIPAEPVRLTAAGVPGGVALAWERTEDPAGGFRVTSPDPNFVPVDVPPDARSARLDGLVDAQVYELRLDVIDQDGYAWPGPEVRTMAGEGIPIPGDAAAWWTFDESAIRAGYSIGDESGNGNTLFVGNDKVELADGVLGKALRFDGETAYARVLSPAPLAIGTGSFAVSFWIRQAPTMNFTERVFEFGGTGEPGLSIMANDMDVRVLFTVGETRYGPFYRGLDMTNTWMHVVVNVDRAGDLAIWVNGEQLVAEEIADTAEVDIPAAPYLHLGRFKNSTNSKNNWEGEIDQVRIFQRALSPAEISALAAEAQPIVH